MTRITSACISLVLALGACVGDPTTPLARSSRLLGIIGDGSTLIQCSAAEPASATSLIGPLGGVVSVGNNRVVIPANAVLQTTAFTLKIPASRYVEIEVTANGAEHFVFASPVTVTLDYDRCVRNDILRAPLMVWNIDPVSKSLLKQMIGVDDRITRSITFSTIHFSGYAVAD